MFYKQSQVDLTLHAVPKKTLFSLPLSFTESLSFYSGFFSSCSLLIITSFLEEQRYLCVCVEEEEMGNCQAVDAAALVLQHPDGKIDRYYGPISVSEIMRMYPGHYVSLIIPLPETNIPATTTTTDDKSERRVVRFTRVKLLRPTDSLVLGHAYRLITSQEVMKVLRAKRYAKTKKHQSETTKEKKKSSPEKKIDEESDKNQNLETKDGKQRAVLTSSASSKSKTWRPSLQSISEATS